MTDPEFRDVFGRNKDVVYRFAYRMTGSGSTAEDVVQECFLALWKKPEAYDPNRGPVRAFLLGIARKLILRRWRDERPHEALDDESFTCCPVDLVNNERSEIIARAVQILPPLQREVLILAEYEELSLSEIARATEAALGTVKSRLHRARENLRRMLSPLLESKDTLYEIKR